MKSVLAILLLLFLIAGCAVAPKPDRLVLQSAGFRDLPGWLVDDQSEALVAFEKSCARFLKQPAGRVVKPLGRTTVADWQNICRNLPTKPVSALAARRYFETWFTPWKVHNNRQTTGVFTGYFEPEIQGSTSFSPNYTIPLYRRPPDLISVDLGKFRKDLKGRRVAGRVVNRTLFPFDTRKDISEGALTGQRLELLWARDPIDVFFLQIQGSGRVVLPDGTVKRIGYDGQNGHPYFAIGRRLIKDGHLTRENVSMQSIRAWLVNNPDQAHLVMNQNASYVFFRMLSTEGPIGAEGVVLTPERSLAIDHQYLPYGLPIWLNTTLTNRPLQRLLITQDTGGAISGPIRGDVFWGPGKTAAQNAGHMNEQGEYWILLPKGR